MDESKPSTTNCSNNRNITGAQEGQLGTSTEIGEIRISSQVHLLNITCNDNERQNEKILNVQSSNTIPLLLIHNPSSIIIKTQDLTRIETNSLNSLNIGIINKPHSLFFLAFSKLNESSMNTALLHRLNNLNLNNVFPVEMAKPRSISIEPSPPDSLTSAPPSYSFVLRQMATRRRPRLMGTFIPSPSFVQHTPPPNYAAAFDIYVDNTQILPQPRTYNFSYEPIPVVCPHCGSVGMTVIKSQITGCTHLCACSLCLFCCWVCAPLPYMFRSCKDVHHYCSSCHHYLGMYCPTNAENG